MLVFKVKSFEGCSQVGPLDGIEVNPNTCLDFNEVCTFAKSNGHPLIIFDELVQDSEICRLEAHSILDLLKLFLFIRENPEKRVVIFSNIPILSQVLGKIAGSFWDYAPDEPFKLQELLEIYQYRSITKETALFGLIGHPVEQSLGHFAHNAVMKDLDAIYLKMAILQEELSIFIPLAKQVGFRGLSVTMPLKESVMDWLDEIDEHAHSIGAVNTITSTKGKYCGYNTDGIGALNAIEKKGLVHGKRVLVLGTGGAAKAIIKVAYERGAHLIIASRTPAKAVSLAKEVGGKGIGLDEIANEDYEVLINCTPDYLPVSSDCLKEGVLVMDIKTLEGDHSLLSMAKEKGLEVVFGFEMFINQASLQQRLWFNKDVYSVISKEITKRLM